jgi:enediyne biosynthesis protein E4
VILMPDKEKYWQVANKLTMALILTISIGAFLAARGRTNSLLSDPHIFFLDVSQRAGIDFIHSKASFDPRVSNIMPWLASVGASASAADYENSGRVSVFLTNSGAGTQDVLYRNEGTFKGVPHFRDVTAEVGLTGLNESGASMAAAWGDFDNDGYPDLYVVRAQAGNLLFHNVAMLDENGHPVLDQHGIPRRKFVNVTDSAGVGYVGYGVGALWFDYDRDGRLDLLVANYFAPKYLQGDVSGKPLDLWHVQDTRFMPESFNDAANGGGVTLYHNDGEGHFTEVTRTMGLTHTGWALAVGAADLNNDGWPDLYVANDLGPDDLYMNLPGQGGGRRFVRVVGGVTADKIGRDTKKGMNVDFADIDHTGYLSIYVTNITKQLILPEGNMLWTSQADASRPGGRNYLNRAEQLGVHDCGWSWGAKFADVDNDGWNDLFVVNGMISASQSQSYWYELQNMVSDYRTILSDAANWPPMKDKSLSGYEPSCLFVRKGEGFANMASVAGINDQYDGRGVALADFNNDGAPDFLVSNQGQPSVLYLNQLYERCKGEERCPGWIGFHLVGNGTTSNRDAIGARVEVVTSRGHQFMEVSRGNGFASQSDPRVRFGLGDAAVQAVRVTWPDGKVQNIELAQKGIYNELHEAQ